VRSIRIRPPDQRWIRFLSGPTATAGKLLRARDKGSGDPKFHQLEPHQRLADST
jgi:hypothetical protein